VVSQTKTSNAKKSTESQIHLLLLCVSFASLLGRSEECGADGLFYTLGEGLASGAPIPGQVGTSMTALEGGKYALSASAGARIYDNCNDLTKRDHPSTIPVSQVEPTPSITCISQYIPPPPLSGFPPQVSLPRRALFLSMEFCQAMRASDYYLLIVVVGASPRDHVFIHVYVIFFQEALLKQTRFTCSREMLSHWVKDGRLTKNSENSLEDKN
jgi:hypothetical protein